MSEQMTLKAGDSLVWWNRERLPARPLGYTVVLTKGDWLRLRHDDRYPLRAGDVLTFPHEFAQAWIDIRVAARVESLGCFVTSWLPLRLVFTARERCRFCDTDEMHDAEIPVLTALLGRYVLRTCRVCGNSWEQQADC